MEYQDFIKKGAKVRYTYRDYDYYSATQLGWGPIPYTEYEEAVKVAGRPRDEYSKKFVSLEYCDDEQTEVLCEFEDGRKEYIELFKLSLYNELTDLTDEQLYELFNSVPVGSMYYDDFNNDFGVDNHQVLDFVDGFLESIEYDDDLCRACNFVDYVRGN